MSNPEPVPDAAEALAEVLTAAVDEWSRPKTSEEFGGDLVRDFLLPALSPALDAVKAEAWDRGMRTGTSRAMRHMSDEPHLPLASDADNPYLASTADTNPGG